METDDVVVNNKTTVVQWKDSYCVGVSEIDDQHKCLFVLINKLIGAVNGGSAIEDIGGILDELFDYIELHFATEEKLTKDHPDFAEHKRAHIKFINSISTFVQRFLEGDVDIAFELIDFLMIWLVDHIMGTDQKQFVWLHKNGYI